MLCGSWDCVDVGLGASAQTQQACLLKPTQLGLLSVLGPILAVNFYLCATEFLFGFVFENESPYLARADLELVDDPPAQPPEYFDCGNIPTLCLCSPRCFHQQCLTWSGDVSLHRTTLDHFPACTKPPSWHQHHSTQTEQEGRE